MTPAMRKPMIRMLIGVGILFGLIFGYHAFGGFMMRKYISAMAAPPVTVSALNGNQ